MYFICKLDTESLPEAVSIATRETFEDPLNLLKVVNQSERSKRYNLTACVSPLFGNFDNFIQLIEWIELNKLLGIEHFNFYISDVSKNVWTVLDYYQSKGEAELLPWTLPLTEEDVHYNGQLAAINDCLYRNKHSTEWLQVTDLDEFIVPQNDTTYSILDVLRDYDDATEVVFRHAHFLSSVRMPPAKKKTSKYGDDLIKHLTSQNLFLMSSNILPANARSKIIVKPRHIVTMGIHQVWAAMVGHVLKVVDVNVCILQHYRDTLDGVDSSAMVLNNATLRYKQLEDRVGSVLEAVNLNI
ncbi:beta-1,4-galactosyltransferase galt-1-like [Mya arenaria]|uniref:beta-1,4-galactosyltransferase galt-1-like n=1 Tax=Mya arenaria TaxID=6604 RepID=UPI0022E7B324|nr:beta-1,4-galactosyltransferase galt-1-like [Mya arenaria]